MAVTLDIAEDIHSLSNFKRNTSDFVRQLKLSGRPVVLTVNGKAELVVQDACSYQRMMDAMEYLETVEGIRRGLKDFEEGRVVSLEEFERSMREEGDV